MVWEKCWELAGTIAYACTGKLTIMQRGLLGKLDQLDEHSDAKTREQEFADLDLRIPATAATGTGPCFHTLACKYVLQQREEQLYVVCVDIR